MDAVLLDTAEGLINSCDTFRTVNLIGFFLFVIGLLELPLVVLLLLVIPLLVVVVALLLLLLIRVLLELFNSL